MGTVPEIWYNGILYLRLIELLLLSKYTHGGPVMLSSAERRACVSAGRVSPHLLAPSHFWGEINLVMFSQEDRGEQRSKVEQQVKKLLGSNGLQFPGCNSKQCLNLCCLLNFHLPHLHIWTVFSNSEELTSHHTTFPEVTWSSGVKAVLSLFTLKTGALWRHAPLWCNPQRSVWSYKVL